MTQKIWLAADYHLPITYSCAMPLSSPHSVQCLPAPGPATVKLALIRNSIELFGLAETRDILFPMIQETEILIRPPTKVGISSQTLRLYKANEKDNQTSFVESIGYREFAHAYDPLTIFILIPESLQDRFIELLNAVGYWGQASSLAYCQRVYEEEPLIQETIQPLSAENMPLEDLFTAFIVDWKKEDVIWDIVTGSKSDEFLKPILYVFPLEVCEQQSGEYLLVSRSLEVNTNLYK